ncbi:hypothetical protein JD79_02671 [Geodermatophilus normandii]|uniref:Uncharacterized protein n=1 Tax=Geodermatophilus normandii TaxID=1137989 RepID=A0A317QL17_9ACTN|nr:hypothetical protein [Geodermatophilus normandii]PWW23497.1 hypothetical protein JD79_02671 [Geodermatophilus normandii]
MSSEINVAELLDEVPGVSAIDASADRRNSVNNTVVRCVYDGRRAVAVGTSTKNQIDGLLDLVDLHLHSAAVVGDTAVASDEVVLLLVQDDWDTEAEGALRTLAAQLQASFSVRLKRLNSRGEVLPISASGLDDMGDHEKYRYTEWRRYLLDLGEQPPTLVNRLLAAVPREEFRAYPMLTRTNWWSLRLEGLEVAQIGPRQGRLDVGRDYEGRSGPERTTWLSTVPVGSLEVTDEDASVARAAAAINAFADAWNEVLADQPAKQKEHTLEARVLRGLVPVHASTGRLELLQPVGDQRVNWGSQFPTRWGRTTSNAGRYLDALLRDGATPWALELKTEGSAGVAGYYRHAVGQAVLYRHFIRQAVHLAPWFNRFGLDQTACRAAVVVPEYRAETAGWGERLKRVCEVFDVELITVPERFARAGAFTA